MTRIVMIGGGLIGSCAAMMLADDGHDVTVLERDPEPAPPPVDAWDNGIAAVSTSSGCSTSCCHVSARSPTPSYPV